MPWLNLYGQVICFSLKSQVCAFSCFLLTPTSKIFCRQKPLFICFLHFCVTLVLKFCLFNQLLVLPINSWPHKNQEIRRQLPWLWISSRSYVDNYVILIFYIFFFYNMPRQMQHYLIDESFELATVLILFPTKRCFSPHTVPHH